MWGIMKDEEEEVTWGFHIHLKMPQQHPEPTQQPRCVFDKSYDCPDELRGGETCSAFWSVLTTHKHTHTLARGQAYTHSCRHRYTLHEFTGYRAWMGTQAFFYCKWFSLYEGICAVLQIQLYGVDGLGRYRESATSIIIAAFYNGERVLPLWRPAEKKCVCERESVRIQHGIVKIFSPLVFLQSSCEE